MEVMEDGNLMDKVHILIQRDMEYYNNKQSILQESLCPGVVGGKLDFPRSASFAAIKLVLWWEEEYVAAFRRGSGFLLKSDSSPDENTRMSGGCGGIVKSSDPAKFVTLITKSAEQLLDHLHMLTQEALDHADLTVLTGTIGATALLRNCLWFYIQSSGESTKGPHMQQLHTIQKKYQEMAEALAERLLDLHCRLLSLYILQDADCLDWENSKPFCESERGSYVIQMWWLYMQGTKDDLWNTVPPTMAQRVFAGMLNESLTILAVRYSQAIPSEARSQLLVVDISNLLLCIAQLLPAICNNAEELMGISLEDKSKMIRDIHTKCQELLCCFLFRGAPLDILNKVSRKGAENLETLRFRGTRPSPWVMFGLPNVFPTIPKGILKMPDLNRDAAVSLELMVFLSQPQPNWAMLLKILGMANCKVLYLILDLAMSKYHSEIQKGTIDIESCQGFLCPGDGTCKNVDETPIAFTQVHYYDHIKSATDVLLALGNEDDFRDILLSLITKQPDWSKHFDRRNVWNQIRPPWFESMVDLIKPILPVITRTVIDAVRTGASMYQAMSLVLTCFSHFWDCTNPILPILTNIIQDTLPSTVIPLGRSVIVQVVISALYTELLRKSKGKKEVKFQDAASESVPARGKDTTTVHKDSVASFDGTTSSEDAIALAIAESLCSLDEDNKHTDLLEEFISQGQQFANSFDCLEGSSRVEKNFKLVEAIVSDLLMTPHGKRSLKIINHFIKNNSEWLFQKLNVSGNEETCVPDKVTGPKTKLLHIMFHIGYRSFDQLLTGEWKPDWMALLETPMGWSLERIWTQLSRRWEFRNVNDPNISASDAYIINHLISLLKQS